MIIIENKVVENKIVYSDLGQWIAHGSRLKILDSCFAIPGINVGKIYKLIVDTCSVLQEQLDSKLLINSFNFKNLFCLICKFKKKVEKCKLLKIFAICF